jgi:hypothetical protein
LEAVLVALGLIIVLASCDAAAGTSSTPGATPAPTLAALPTVAPAQAAAGCGGNWTTATSFVRLGDLIVAQARLGGLAYPSVQVPDGTLPKPLDVKDANASALSRALPVNPAMQGAGAGFALDLCNRSASQAQTLSGLTVRLDAFTPYTGQLNTWSPCQPPFSPQGPLGGGCGGAVVGQTSVKASFPSGAGVGTTASATPDSGSFLLTLAPGQSLHFTVELGVPAAPGTYTFALGLTVASAAAPVYATEAPAALFAIPAQKWSGDACAAPQYQSQLPKPITSYYLCPTP